MGKKRKVTSKKPTFEMKGKNKESLPRGKNWKKGSLGKKRKDTNPRNPWEKNNPKKKVQLKRVRKKRKNQ